MNRHEKRVVSEQEAREVAESARDTSTREPSFLRELFLGRLRLDLLYPMPRYRERPAFRQFYEEMKAFLRDEVNPIAIDATGEYPPRVIQRLRELGAFGMKIPEEYGGLGFTQYEYDEVMKLLGGVDGNLTALISAHQSIGVPQPLKLFGTEEQKRAYLPRLAAGAISAFALTEPDVGSDPARLATSATRDGDHYVLNGEKLWTTNGTLAELILVMARHSETGKISAFIVEMSAPGVKVEHRCHFMGLRALANAVISFTDVRVPEQNRIGAEGQGLKIALTTLNTGRLALPAAAVGGAKVMLEVSRTWAARRVQWGRPIGKHEAIAHKLADMAVTTFTMEALTDIASRLADRSGYDIRLEAAAAKEWNSTRGWWVVDEAMQIRGGRGYETEASLLGRGEPPIGVERAMRDSRINRIFEGSSEIMHLFIAREAVDPHLKVAGKLIDPRASSAERAKALPRIGAFYAAWYPTRYVGWARWPRHRHFGKLGRHLRWAERRSRRLARAIFHGMSLYQGRLQHRQAFLFRVVDIGLELFAMTAAVLRAQQMLDERRREGAEAVELADLFCRAARRRIRAWSRALFRNDDRRAARVGGRVLAGRHAWVEQGGLGLAERHLALVPEEAAEHEAA